MNDKLEETVHDNKTLRLNNLEIYVLTEKRFNTYMVLIFSDLNKTQIYKIPNTNSSHRENEILMNFKYLNLFKPNQHNEDYYIRKPNDKIFCSNLNIKNKFM